jgi:hypothetical protein
MPKKFTIGTYDKKHKENLAKRARKVQQLYDAAVKRIAQAAAPSLFDADPKKEFHFEDFPALKKEMEALMQDLGSSLQANIEDGDQESWTLSNTKNDAMVDSIIGKKKLPAKTVKAWKHPHLEALNAFIARKEAGMNLSRRVWNLTQQFKSEMELALELGMGEGKSAAALSRDIRKYLAEPNKLFRRVRDKSGALRLSKAAAAYHPGQGVYRSSYKNALRMTATENNIAYRTADHNRWQALPFVIGIEIHISNNHPTEDICDLFDDKRFPKDFKFTGWHPWCRCYAVSVLASQEEMDAYTTALMNGEDVSNWKFTGQVEKMPNEFNKWMKDNQARIENATSMPYFIKDNFKDGDPAKGLRWEGMEKSNKKDGAIAATPKSKPADEWKGISKNDRELLELVQTEGWTEQNQDHYRDLLDKAYDAEMKKANLKPTKLRTKAEEDAVDSFRQWGFEELNEALRAGKPLNAKQREVQEQIDKIMSRTTLKKDIVVYRGTKDAPIDINPAYSSTTTRITIAEHFSSEMYGSKHLYAYRIPKGTHCLVIGGAEDEIVLPRGFNLGQCKIGARKQNTIVKPTPIDIAAKRHAARTSEQIADIKDAWRERRLDAYDNRCDKMINEIMGEEKRAYPALAKRQAAIRTAIGQDAPIKKVNALFNKFKQGFNIQKSWNKRKTTYRKSSFALKYERNAKAWHEKEPYKFKSTESRTIDGKNYQCDIYCTPGGTEIIVPKNLPANYHLDFREIARVLESLPVELKAQAEKIQLLNDYYSSDAYFQKIYKNFTHGYAYGGNGTITFCKSTLTKRTAHKDLPRTLAHENGHSIDHKIGKELYGMDISKTKEWQDAQKADEKISKKKSPTSYGENAPTEDFAESCNYLVTQRKKFERDFPNRYKILKRILGI